MFGPTSFRRILLSRILLLSVPVLSIGQYVTYRKARSSLLETARQNLTESAIRKGNSLDARVTSLKAQLRLASEVSAVESGNPQQVEAFFERLQPQLPETVRCIQLTDLQQNLPIARTCDEDIFQAPPPNWWPATSAVQQSLTHALYATVEIVDPDPNAAISETNRRETYLTFSAPVYPALATEPVYALTLQTRVAEREELADRPGSLTGSTVAIDSDGIILEHPLPTQIGQNTSKEGDAERLENIIKSARAGNQNFQHLFAFASGDKEVLAGYTAIPSPLTADPEAEDEWVILAITPLDSALAGLEPIRQVMFNLVLGLLAANLIATLYLAQDLARPVEKLGEYARNVECNTVSDPMPATFFIHEFNQLSHALNRTIERLKAWAQELEDAWKEAKNANRLKSEFLTTISHELRTPLNGIIGSLRLIQDGFCDDEEEEQEFLQRADDAAIHLLGIIDDILDISKIESGTLSVAIETVDLIVILREVIELQMATVRDRNLTLTIVPDTDWSVWVRADRAKLKQVLLNALGNAVKFTEKGGITISVRVESNSKEVRRSHGSLKEAIVEIIDTGIGVDPAHFDKLFKPFVMVDGSRTRRFGGTGLGLAISRNLIEMMQGSIALHSDGIGCGTTVSICLPVAENTPPCDTPPPANSKPQQMG